MQRAHFALTAAIVSFGIAVACHSDRVAQPVVTEPAPVPEGSSIQPFLSAERCGQCHSQVDTSAALTTTNGDDASPHGTWQATAMANAFRDPYWRAQMAHEVELAPERKAEIEALCLRCHAPIASHVARLTEASPPSIESALEMPIAHEGVSCTICHRTTSEGLGTPASFDGNLAIHGDARIYGPFEDPAPGPMRTMTGYTPTHGPHVQASALCGACHTLTTQPPGGGKPFIEQALYLEWRNSVFSDEGGRTSESKTCQECHMPDAGAMRIAHNPAGLDFNIGVRDPVRTHTFVGGNAFLIDLLRENKQELGVTATDAALKRVAAASRAQLSHSTARLTVSDIVRKPSGLSFEVRIENLAGHKFPSGYPARRAWLYVAVRVGDDTLFESGAVDERGALVGVADEFALPHFDRIERADQVQVYEMISADESGRMTTSLMSMARRTKDNRLLPRGWKSGGPHAEDTRPTGTDGDADFSAGFDTVSYDVPLPETDSALLLIVSLRYQSIPPAWADSLADSKTPEAKRFLAMYARAANEGEAVAFVATPVPR